MIEDVPLIPETAPFSEAQRAWLNGFIAGLFSNGSAVGRQSLATAQSPASLLRSLLLSHLRPARQKG